MGKHARIGLLLGACACLLAIMVDWVIEELREHEQAEQSAEDNEARPATAAESPEAGQPAGGEAVPSEPQAAG
jgi:hypothetical protein